MQIKQFLLTNVQGLRVTVRLEQQTRGNLHLPVTVAVQRAADDSKVGGTDIRTCVSTWIREMRRVCQIVSFTSHFQLEALAYCKRAEQGQIVVIQMRTANGVPSGIAKAVWP